jgi:hypothetical protein
MAPFLKRPGTASFCFGSPAAQREPAESLQSTDPAATTHSQACPVAAAIWSKSLS